MHTALSRRHADDAVVAGRVTINRIRAKVGDEVPQDAVVTLDNGVVNPELQPPLTILLNKPIGYVCSRDGQGSPTVYDLLPEKYHNLNIAGRLDKDSSGLVVFTSDGNLLHELTHPAKGKDKVYEVIVDKQLTKQELAALVGGVDIGDTRPSRFKNIKEIRSKTYEITLGEGRNRQIRRALSAIGIKVSALQRFKLADYELGSVTHGDFKIL